MSNRLWVLGTVLVSIALVVLGWVLGISPRLAEAGIAVTERQNVELQNQAQEAALALLKQQYEELDELEEELDDIQSSIPSKPATSEFFDQVLTTASAAGVAVEEIAALEGAIYGGSVDPAAATDSELVQPADGSAAPDPTLDGSLANRFFTIGVSIKVLGGADQVFSLVSALQEGERLFLVTDVDFTTGTEPRATITGFVYVVTDTTPAVPAQ